MDSTVTLADHEAGFKEIDITFRNGTTGRVRLTAPPRRKVRGLVLEIARENDAWPVVRACLSFAPIGGEGGRRPDEGAAKEFTEAGLMDKLTPASGDLVEVTAFALTFGDAFQKKMTEFGLSMATALTTSAPS